MSPILPARKRNSFMNPSLSPINMFNNSNNWQNSLNYENVDSRYSIKRHSIMATAQLLPKEQLQIKEKPPQKNKLFSTFENPQLNDMFLYEFEKSFNWNTFFPKYNVKFMLKEAAKKEITKIHSKSNIDKNKKERFAKTHVRNFALSPCPLGMNRTSLYKSSDERSPDDSNGTSSLNLGAPRNSLDKNEKNETITLNVLQNNNF